MEDDEDDIYAPDEGVTTERPQEKTIPATERDGSAGGADGGESEEDGDMEEDESDSVSLLCPHNTCSANCGGKGYRYHH
jgi:hypothetical protein